MEEIWRDAPGFEGVYKVSNLGNVISVSYRHTGIPRTLKPKLRGGYLAIHRSSSGGDVPIHRLVAKAFIPNPNNLPCVNHINENKQDNRACNLEWCTYQQNNTYGQRLDKMANTRRNRKQKSHFGKILQYSISGNLIATFESTVAASAAIGIERSSINRCALGQFKTSGGYKWIYEDMNHNKSLNYKQRYVSDNKIE